MKLENLVDKWAHRTKIMIIMEKNIITGQDMEMKNPNFVAFPIKILKVTGSTFYYKTMSGKVSCDIVEHYDDGNWEESFLEELRKKNGHKSDEVVWYKDKNNLLILPIIALALTLILFNK